MKRRAGKINVELRDQRDEEKLSVEKCVMYQFEINS